MARTNRKKAAQSRPSPIEEFIKGKLEGGRFDNASEVVRAGLRLLVDQEKLQALKLAELKAAIQAGIVSGSGVPAEEVFDRLKKSTPPWGRAVAADAIGLCRLT